MTTAIEVLTHIASAAAGAFPTIALAVGERAKRKTAEKQAENATSQAVMATTEAFRATLEQSKSMAMEALEMARGAKKKAEECELGRAAEQRACGEQIDALMTAVEFNRHKAEEATRKVDASDRRVEKMRGELSELQMLISALGPQGPGLHGGVVR